MSLAKITHVKKTRKDWICSKCRKPIPAGSPALNFSVGYRGASQYRHSQAPECFPTREERESSMIAPIYGAIDGASFDDCDDIPSIQGVLSEIADQISEVCYEYEGSPMYEVSEDSQERVSILQDAEEDLRSWEPEDSEESTEGDSEARDAWITQAREDAQNMLDNLELP